MGCTGSSWSVYCRMVGVRIFDFYQIKSEVKRILVKLFFVLVNQKIVATLTATDSFEFKMLGWGRQLGKLYSQFRSKEVNQFEKSQMHQFSWILFQLARRTCSSQFFAVQNLIMGMYRY